MNDDLFAEIQEHLNKGRDEFTLISEEELDFTIMGLATARGDEGFIEEEAFRLVRWIEQTRVNNALVDLFFKGLVLLDDPTGEFKDEIKVKLTPDGIELKEQLT